jgi:hypothetical protein
MIAKVGHLPTWAFAVDWVIRVAIVAFAIVVVWALLRPRTKFVVRVADGKATAVSGTVSAPFIAEVRETCDRHGVRSATVRGTARGPRIALEFSRDIPAAGRQQLRNWWANSGWSTRPARS